MDASATRLHAALSDRYRIEREIGRGGMATVYLAEDLKHHREVALKVMRPELSAILGGERFLREVSIAAKLNHPHILALHDSGQAEEFLYYVMPYVKGESLRAKLKREHQLPVDEAISITRQVGAALDYAHRQGVIHRDIKPENILLHEGEALVADFGIALAVSAAGGTRLTDTGLSLGTPEYMSPEQATGERDLDARSEVYSLGAMTYEMLVGEPPHTGHTVQAIIAKVVSVVPQPVSSVRHSVPSNVDAAVQCALSKIPADRFGSGAEFAEALTNPGFALPAQAGAQAPGAQSEGPWRRIAFGATIVAAVTTLAASWALFRSPAEPPKAVVHATVELPPGEEVGWAPGSSVSLSPDGSRALYVAGLVGRSLRMRSFGESVGDLLPGTENPSDPSFSPDGEAVAYVDYGSHALKVAALDGSLPVTIVDSVRSGCLDWGPDGMLYYCPTAGGLRRVPATGGEPEVLTAPDVLPEGASYRYVEVLPDGKVALFTIWRGGYDDASIGAVEFEGGQMRKFGPGFYPRYASGYLIYLQPGDLQFEAVLSAAPFDPEGLEVGPVTLLMGGITRGTGYGLSSTGNLVYLPLQGYRVQPVWVDRSGDERVVDPEWAGSMVFPALSPDGARLTVSIDGPDGRHVWIKTLDRGSLQRLTFEGRTNQPSAWSPDGRYVLFGSNRAGEGGPLTLPGQRLDLWQKRADGSAPASLVLDLGRDLSAFTYSADGRWIVYGHDGDLYAMPVGSDSGSVPLVTTEHTERSPTLSPDGRWLGYTSDETGRDEVYVRPFPNVDDGRWIVSADGGEQLVWAHNGHELFYVNGSQELVVAEVLTEPTFVVQSRRVLFSAAEYQLLGRHSYSVTPDHERFVLLKRLDRFDELALVLNFFEELKEKVGS